MNQVGGIKPVIRFNFDQLDSCHPLYHVRKHQSLSMIPMISQGGLYTFTKKYDSLEFLPHCSGSGRCGAGICVRTRLLHSRSAACLHVLRIWARFMSCSGEKFPLSCSQNTTGSCQTDQFFCLDSDILVQSNPLNGSALGLAKYWTISGLNY